jgi:hypothetical protein
MPLTKLQFRPGINREITNYSNEGGWRDGDKIRFRFGFPEKIGGWVKKSSNSFLGACRALHPWVTLSGNRLIGVGTSSKYYVEQGGGYNDITPLRVTTAAGDVTFAATTGSATLTVTDTAHGAVAGSFVTFSGATSLGGVITADVLNQEYPIVDVVDNDTFTIEARTANTSISSITVDGQLVPTPVAANASDTSDGGANVVGAYQINIGTANAVVGTGWGVGTWGRSTWGSGVNSIAITDELRLWSHDNFGEDLLINPRNGNIYYWDFSGGFGARAVALEDLVGASSAPTIARQVMVSDQSRHVIAFGCDPEAASGTQDPMCIRFSDQESVTDWTSTATNTAGEIRLSSGSGIVKAVETRQQMVIFTDTTLYTMQYLGPPFTFGVQPVSENITIMGPKAVIAVDDFVFWMGTTEFYAYTGAVSRIPCTVRDYVFDDFNIAQGAKVTAALNEETTEVWWFYPSSSSDENDRYVVYNYGEQIWYYGALDRTAWMDRGIFTFPIAAAPDGYLYEHENGLDDGSTSPASAISAYIESSPVDIADGEQFMFIRRVIPDLQFRDSTNPAPQVDLTLRVRNYSSGAFLASQTNAILDDSEQLYYRLRGRQMSVYFESDQAGTTWRLGSTRVDLKPDGRR